MNRANGSFHTCGVERVSFRAHLPCAMARRTRVQPASAVFWALQIVPIPPAVSSIASDSTATRSMRYGATGGRHGASYTPDEHADRSMLHSGTPGRRTACGDAPRRKRAARFPVRTGGSEHARAPTKTYAVAFAVGPVGQMNAATPITRRWTPARRVPRVPDSARGVRPVPSRSPAGSALPRIGRARRS